MRPCLPLKSRRVLPARPWATALALAALLAGLACGAPAARAAEAVKLYYFHRPPLYMTDAQGRPTGILLERAERILARAGLEISLAEVPAKRALMAIEQGENACGVGWFRLPERERYASFSLPIHRDGPQVAVVRRAVAAPLPKPLKLDDLLTRPLTMGVIDGFNYGATAEMKIRLHGPRTQRLTGEVGQLMQMTALGRCDWFLVNDLEASWYLQHDPRLAQELVVMILVDQPPGNLRYLMCSTALGGAVMDRINRAILELVGNLEDGDDQRRP